jgi:hypothetical protein
MWGGTTHNLQMYLVSLRFLCATPFTLSCRIFPPPLPATKSFSKFMYSEITEESAWRVLLSPPWCCLLLWQLKVIRIGLTLILDFWYPGPSYLAQEVPVLCFFCLYLVSCTHNNNKIRWREHSLADTVPLFSNILQFSSELSYNWGTGLPCLRPLWIYCTGQQRKGFLRFSGPCIFMYSNK